MSEIVLREDTTRLGVRDSAERIRVPSGGERGPAGPPGESSGDHEHEEYASAADLASLQVEVAGKLPLSGGTLTGQLRVPQGASNADPTIEHSSVSGLGYQVGADYVAMVAPTGKRIVLTLAGDIIMDGGLTEFNLFVDPPSVDLLAGLNGIQMNEGDGIHTYGLRHRYQDENLNNIITFDTGSVTIHAGVTLTVDGVNVVLDDDVRLSDITTAAELAAAVSAEAAIRLAADDALDLRVDAVESDITAMATEITTGELTIVDSGLVRVSDGVLEIRDSGAAQGSLQVRDAASATEVMSQQASDARYGRAASVGRYRRPSGAVAESVPRAWATMGNVALLSTGRVTMVGIEIDAGQLITSITFVSGTTALSAGTHQWFALCNSSRVQLRATSDDTSTAWANNAPKTLNLSSTFTTTYTGMYYVAIMVTASTVPTLSATTTSSGVGSIVPILAGSSNSSQTTPQADGFAFNALSSLTGMAYAYVS